MLRVLARRGLAAHRMARFYASFPPHTVIDMPALSPTMTQGNVGAWKKAVGESLAPGDVLVEVETDKATMDFEFQEDGFLAKVLLDEGAKDVPVGQPIGVYVENAEDVSAFADFTAADAGKAPAPPKEPEATPSAPKEPEAAPSAPKEASAAPSAPKEASAAATPKINASPLAKTIALEKGINLNTIKGSGPGGRIIKRDLESAKPQAAQAAAPQAAAASASSRDIEISGMRKTIAKRLTESKHQNPDYIVSTTVSVSKLLELRKALNASLENQRISVNDILIKAMAIAARKVPAANSHWLESEGVIREFRNVDVSVAVATPNGLITPVVKDADKLGLAEISTAAKDLGKRAREGKLKPEEYQGGTITISNLGMNHAVDQFTAIINPPQSTIIAVGTTKRVAVEDPESETGISFDDVMTLTASFDHKVVDGAVGGEYIKALKTVLENPLTLML